MNQYDIVVRVHYGCFKLNYYSTYILTKLKLAKIT